MATSDGAGVSVHGHCDPRFAAVGEEFARNFAERGELGASVCLVVGGETVVDLWGGTADETSGRPWNEDTVNVVCSCSKGVAALCVHILIDRGEIDPEAPVARYWPEFAAEGKAEIPVHQVLSHQAGLYTFGEQIPAEQGAADWERCVDVLARTRPLHAPGTRQAYHGVTLGYLVGELVRRVDGRSIGTFLQEEVSGPLGLDLWFGIPPEVEERVAPSIRFDLSQLPPELLAKLMDPESPASKVFANTGGWMEDWDHPVLHAAELPAVGAITNARGLAGMYAPLATGGSTGDVDLVGEATIARMATVRAASDHDIVLQHPATFTMGLSASWSVPVPGGGYAGVVIGDGAFGTPGYGGNMGFADPHHGIGFGYTMNRHGMGTTLNERGQSLIDATYRTLGSPGCETGVWRRPD